MAVPVQSAEAAAQAQATSPVKVKDGLEVLSGQSEDVANKSDENNARDINSQGEVSTPEDAKSRVPRPYLEIETGDEEDTTSPDYNDRKISLDLTPLSCKSTDSSAEYHQPNQTVIIFDWDDTLCPSTTCMRTHGLSVLGALPEGELAAALEELAAEGRVLIEAAFELAEKVVIVTNAEEGWVDLSCRAWLPGLQDIVAKCEVLSARSTWEPQGVQSPAGWKARTFEDVIEKFYSRYQNQSWKNIISVGDAPHEREALARVVRWAPTASGKRCRSKSVKFVLRPSIDHLTRELQMLRESLKEIVWHDDDLDLHFSAESLAEPLIN
mmetsp:Transcript_87199/g.154444  ORF Transcript_87199/g.154444 Transcript_87199/m.154444 type:complete len:325 (+) Transcript_87199:77-1051(+)|eukprot:CAMPEP_0197660790 /NCGR_PEP_ID=MMETSP1338-20131121/51064_1 /TAXON_ID=43686 ORGANISM="Pelagodinium beii, Strain RCC1491" /NCGR_SAMPLE_ID=MMETSP1338 /ASSEMBLY_ACC=CAM_ASM_000754 /LENGTH=324 /DNA_ID=CAMNT_0043238217 /DNA_START=53 /DNA_END=1027 /DNA_ORIENTATION=+